MENLPFYVPLIFTLTTLLTVWIFYKASKNSPLTLVILIAWMVVQTPVAYSGFYTVTNTIPPRLILLVLPPLLFILGLFLTRSGRQYLDTLDPKILTILHIVRIPVEIVLFWLFIHEAIPQLMTFEGRNLDILSGITAPVVYYFGFVKKKMNNTSIILWNLICLGLLFNIVITAILSAPTPFQKLAFDQPNVGVLYFPFIWLPCLIVPLVLLSHLTVIRHLMKIKVEDAVPVEDLVPEV
jgi:hypothetical protein